MLYSAVNFIVILFSANAYGLSDFGCIHHPEKCPPPNLCYNDGMNGNCISQKYEWHADKYQQLYEMVLHVQSYLRSQKLEFSDLSEFQLDELASEMARLFLKEKEIYKKKRTQRLISVLHDEKLRLAQQGVKLSQLTKEQKQALIHTVLDKYMKSEGKIDENQISHPDKPSSEAVDSDIVDDKSSEQSPTRQTVKAKHAILPPPRTSSDDESDEDAIETKLPLQSNDANPVSKDISLDQAKGDSADVKDQISKVETRGDEDASQDGQFNDPPTENVVFAEKQQISADSNHEEETYIVVIIIVAVLVVCIIIIAITIYCMKSNRNKNKLLTDVPFHSGKDYQALCRQHYASKSGETTEVKQPLVSTPKTRTNNSATPTKVFSPSAHQRPYHDTESRNSSVSSWSEEPVTSSMDILTGHAVLNYMEDHLKNKDRLAREWEGLCNYKAEKVSTSVAQANPTKNRFSYAVPYDGNRVKLNVSGNTLESDYINASFIIDNDPRWPVYIATQGPLSSTIHDFWQMVWEQGATVIVMLTPLIEEGISQCARYWPDELEGSTTYGNYEINLVSEHVWRDDYLVRSLYLKNLNSGHTRTVTQFHFLSWPKNGIPTSSRQLLELRRKVSKCYRGNALSPAVVHCSDGCGRTGSYILIDLVLARILKGTSKEIDIAATLEHLRDQRAGGMVSSKEQLKFALNCVADEVNAILKVIQ